MALDIFAEFAVDEKKEEAGVWKEIGDDAKLLIARAQNRNFGKELAKEYEKNKKLLDTKGEAGEKKSEEIMIGVIAKTILLGWEGIKFKGKDFPYSLDNAKELLKLKEFRKLVVTLSDDFDAYRAVVESEIEKN